MTGYSEIPVKSRDAFCPDAGSIPLIADCDPGADDALALLYLLSEAGTAASGMNLAGVTTVCGNGPVSVTSENAAKILAMAKRTDLPVFRGAEQPLQRSLRFSNLYCGEDGLCETGLPSHKELIRPGKASEFIARTCLSSETPVTILCMAGLTNLAAAMREYPQICDRIGRIVTSSGCFGLNAYAVRQEWNAAVDPEATRIVYESGAEIYAVGLEVTAQLTSDCESKIRTSLSEGPVRTFMEQVLAFNLGRNLDPQSILVDAMAAAAANESGLAHFQTGNVTVDISAAGPDMMTFAPNPDGKVHAADRYDFSRFASVLIEGLERMNQI